MGEFDRIPVVVDDSEYLEEVRNVMAARYVEVDLLLTIVTPILADIISGTVQADLAAY